MTITFTLHWICFSIMLWYETTAHMFQPTLRYHLRMMKDETFEIEDIQFSQTIRYVHVNESDIEDPLYNQSLHATWKNYNKHFFFIYNNDEGHCQMLTQISEKTNNSVIMYANYGRTQIMPYQSGDKRYPINFAFMPAINTSRTMKTLGDTVYLTNMYSKFMLPHKSTTIPYNRIETIGIQYNATHITDIKEIGSLDIPYTVQTINGQPMAVATQFCFWSEYIDSYKEIIYLCMNLVGGSEPTGVFNPVIIFKRPKLNREVEIGQLNIKWSDIRPPLNYYSNDDFFTIVNPTPEGVFELIFAMKYCRDLLLVNFNNLEIFNTQKYAFPFEIWKLDYSSRILMLVYTDFNTVKSIERDPFTYYLERYPGSKIKVNEFVQFSDSELLKTHFSNENIEIVLEMYKRDSSTTVGPASFPSITHNLYSYNLVSKQMLQISTQIFILRPHPAFFGLIYKTDSFSFLDNILLNVNCMLISYPSQAARYRLGWLVWIDSYSGFGGCNDLNARYPLYNVLEHYDHKHNQHFLLPFGVNIVVGTVAKPCQFFRQRLQVPKTIIKYNLKGAEEYPYLNLSYWDRDRAAKPLYQYHFKFYEPTDLNILHNLWEGSDIQQYYVTNSIDKKSINLNLLVRGSFIISKLDLPGDDYNYDTETLSTLHNDITSHSFFNIDNYRIDNNIDLIVENIEYVYALSKTSQIAIQETYLLLKKKGSYKVKVLSIKNNKMTTITDLSLADNILKVMMVQENLYVMFTSVGNLQMFNASSFEIYPLTFPGINCVDMEIMSHVSLKPCFICLNLNFEFAAYYMDELITKSLSNSMVNIVFKANKDNYLSKESKLLTSEFYSGMIFVYHPDAQKNKPNLSIYYLEIEEFPTLVFVKSFVLKNSKSEAIGITCKVVSMEFANERLVVHFRQSDSHNWIGVYEFDYSMDMNTIKIYEIPNLYDISGNVKLQKFYKHRQSSIYKNADQPMMLLPFKRAGANNIMVIDPFAPFLETVPTVLLPRNSLSQQFIMFPYYISSFIKHKYYSAGILHFNSYSKQSKADALTTGYLFQLITASAPQIPVLLSKFKLLSYKHLFSSYVALEGQLFTFKFESHLYIGKNLPNKTFTKLVDLMQPTNSSKVFTLGQAWLDKTVDIENVYQKSNANLTNSEIQLLNIPYLNLVNGTVFDWETEPEGFFEQATGVFSARKPIELVSEKTINSIEGLVKAEYYCNRYVKSIEGEVRCYKRGLILFFEEEAEIYYQDKFETLDSSTSIRVRYDANQCLQPIVLNHTWVTICIDLNKRQAVFTSFNDLSQQHVNCYSTSLYPKISFGRSVTVHNNSFVQYFTLLVDEMGEKGFANYYTFKHNLTYDKSQTTSFKSPFVHSFIKFSAVGSKVTDAAPGAVYLKKENTFRFSNIFVHVGNKVLIQMFEYAYSIVPRITPIEVVPRGNAFYEEHSRDNFDNMFIIGLNSTRQTKQVAYSHATVQEIYFNKSDLITESNFTDFQRFSLVVLPNYHSYLFRHGSPFNTSNFSIYKISNPFAEIVNTFRDSKAVCHKWACILVSEFEGKAFIRVYDMNYEQMMTPDIAHNFQEIFDSTKGNDPSHPTTLPTPENDMDKIPEHYTLFPIQVYNITNLQMLMFDEASSTDQYLVLIAFITPNKIQKFEISRNYTLKVRNLYFTSNYILLRAKVSFLEQKIFKILFKNYMESDFYKYLIHITFIFVATGAGLMIYLKYLKKESFNTSNTYTTDKAIYESAIVDEDGMTLKEDKV